MDTQSNPFLPPVPEGQIEIGTVGWDDREDHAVVGEVGGDAEGYTLIRVQLFRDRDITKPLTPTIGQGHKLLCHMSSAIGRIPPKGTRCYVAIPNRMAQSHSAVVIATVEKNRVEQLETGRVVQDYTGQKLIIKADDIVLQSTTGNVVLMTTDDGTAGGKVIGLKIGHSEIKCTAPWGSWVTDASGYHLKTKSGNTRLDMGGLKVPGLSDIPGVGALLNAFTGYIKLTAPMITAAGNSVYLGVGAAGYNTAVHAPADGMTVLGTGTPIATGPTSQSATVYVSK